MKVNELPTIECHGTKLKLKYKVTNHISLKENKTF